ncbi:unnamed protein product [Fusarium langsethiae]|nr:unnamed protein product [Fusarium langsethiae]
MTPDTVSEAGPVEHWPDSSRGGVDTLIYTPTSSEIGYTSNDSFGLTRKSDPHRGGKYLILDVSRSRALTCHDGHLRLEPIDLKDPRRHISEQAQWECNERAGQACKQINQIKSGA